jgi:hypothetical protein
VLFAPKDKFQVWDDAELDIKNRIRVIRYMRLLENSPLGQDLKSKFQ